MKKIDEILKKLSPYVQPIGIPLLFITLLAVLVFMLMTYPWFNYVWMGFIVIAFGIVAYEANKEVFSKPVPWHKYEKGNDDIMG